ncbi:MAG: hypothetical protein AAF664_20310, partial [Planctomycetota bacterium]
RGGDGQTWSVLAADGMKHVRNGGSPKPALYSTVSDPAEAENLLGTQSERASQMFDTWQAWNNANVPGRLIGYIDYHKRRDRFYSEAVPKPALDAGYKPSIKGNFK